ncbi:Hypothetical predicted protein [Olea europaea subsp. europaea]|uniref:Uncharacterized protein n=1 Tax=Olea europaea subsp. europaea TaxID=158383 RepID=A0A8S0Q044_OLEEU|nr:Hypothetical predicted protein [Olea europaea subsp. europaea]
MVGFPSIGIRADLRHRFESGKGQPKRSAKYQQLKKGRPGKTKVVLEWAAVDVGFGPWGIVKIDDPERDEAVNFRSVDQMDAQLHNHNVPSSKPCDTQLDDIESETDHYMDALNAIESEPETDVDCLKKQVLAHCITINWIISK